MSENSQEEKNTNINKTRQKKNIRNKYILL